MSELGNQVISVMNDWALTGLTMGRMEAAKAERRVEGFMLTVDGLF
jgi:hypothetical protein